MATLYDPAARAAIQSRVDTLTASRQPLWGKMNVGQMLVHCDLQLQHALGELRCVPMSSPAGRFPLKQLIIYVLPTPKSVPTMTELRDPVAGSWEADRSRLKQNLERLGAVPSGTRMADHAAFGAMSHRAWGVLSHKHMDHHLRQFGA